jgi:hypothetical protein
MLQRLALSLVVLLLFIPLAVSQAPTGGGTGRAAYGGDPLIQEFDVWGSLTHQSRIVFYSGWANGLFTTTKDPGTVALGHCLEKLSFEQIVSMVDKRYADHREDFRNPISKELIEVFTAAGSPCEGIRVGSS